MSTLTFILLGIFLPSNVFSAGILEMYDIDDAFYDIWNSRRHSDTYDNNACRIRYTYNDNSNAGDIDPDDNLNDDNNNYDNEVGTCMKRKNCVNQGGKDFYSYKCAPFGTCCVVNKRCGQSTHSKISYFSSENSKNTNNKDCTYKVYLQKNVCQVRVDFLRFELAYAPLSNPPFDKETAEYKCKDFLAIDGLEQNHYCGKNTGQHVYLHVNNFQRDYIQFTHFRNTDGNSNAFKIKITQLDCGERLQSSKFNKNSADLALLAPEGCLQYFRSSHGQIRSLGYNPEGKDVVPTPPDANPNTPSNDYTICIKKPSGSKSIKYTATKSIYIPPITTQGTEDKCTNYLYIPGIIAPATPTTPQTPVARYCITPELFTGVIDSRSPGVYYMHFKNPRGAGHFDLTYNVN